MKKIFPKKANVDKPVAVAHVYGDNVIEIKRGKDVIKIIAKDCQILTNDPIEGDKVQTLIEVENGKIVSEDLVIKEYDDKGNEVKGAGEGA